MSAGSMRLPKAPPELVDAFTGLAAGLFDVEQRKMFGFPALFINGNMFAGLMGDRMVLRLAEADRERLIAAGEAAPSEAMGRVMKEWVRLDPKLAEASVARSLLELARAHTASLPPKAVKARKAKR